MKRLFCFVTILITLFLQSQTSLAIDLSEYFYPFGCREYSITTEASLGQYHTIMEYSFDSNYYGNFLEEHRNVYSGFNLVMSNKMTYKYETEGDKVISKAQFRRNPQTRQIDQTTDKLVLFALPNGDKPFTWTETDRGDTYKCKSEYVYINCCRGSQMKQAVKITRETTINSQGKKQKVIEWSYWVEGWGRIVTYGQWGDADARIVSLLQLPFELRNIQEVTKDDYDRFYEIKRQQEELERRQQAEVAFLSKIEPDKLYVYSDQGKKIKEKCEELFTEYLILSNKIIEDPENIEIRIDVNKEGIVTTSLDKSNIGVADSLRNYIKGMLASGELTLRKRTDSQYGFEAIIPLYLQVSLKYTRIEYDVMINCRKGVWSTAKHFALPEDDALFNYFCSEIDTFLAQHPKEKKLLVSIVNTKVNEKNHIEKATFIRL